MKQDRTGVRTAQDIERKYPLDEILGVKKAIEKNETELININKDLENFVSSTVESIDNLQNQIDGQIHTYYYSGVPTLENLPANEWLPEEYKNYVGDLYYDKDTGYAYRFILDNTTNVYGWVRVTDDAVTEALAIANAAQDTADSKRRVFLLQPEPPYDNGDLWLNEQEIYVCQISKPLGETYEENDFIIATKYTDDTQAIKVGENLEILRGTVLTIKESTDEFKIQFDTTTTALQNQTKETQEALETMSYSFGTKDLKIADSTDPVNARFNNQGVKVYTHKELETIMNHNGLGTNKLIVIGDAQVGNLRIVKAVDENGNACTDFHHLISTIQDITDLE
jgi:phage-related protein